MNSKTHAQTKATFYVVLFLQSNLFLHDKAAGSVQHIHIHMHDIYILRWWTGSVRTWERVKKLPAKENQTNNEFSERRCKPLVNIITHTHCFAFFSFLPQLFPHFSSLQFLAFCIVRTTDSYIAIRSEFPTYNNGKEKLRDEKR